MLTMWGIRLVILVVTFLLFYGLHKLDQKLGSYWDGRYREVNVVNIFKMLGILLYILFSYSLGALIVVAGAIGITISFM